MKIIRAIKGIALMGGLIAGGSVWAQTLVWNGADGANWNGAGVWRDAETSEAADWTSGADVVFPANGATQEIALAENVTAGTITFNGSYTFTGGGKPTGTEITVAAGTVTFPASLPKQKMTIAEGATAIVSGTLTTAGWYQVFLGSGTLILDGFTLKLSSNGDYGAWISAFTGTVIARNGTVITTTQNNKSSNQLGQGTFVFAGATIHCGNSTSGFGSCKFHFVAGTVNVVNMWINLDNAAIVKGDEELATSKDYLVLTASSKGGTASTSQELSDAGWSSIETTTAEGKYEVRLSQLRFDPGEGNALSLGKITSFALTNELSVLSGTVVLAENTPKMKITVAEGATLVVTHDAVQDGWFKWFNGTGTLIIDGCAVRRGSGDYGSALSSFAGTLVGRNGAEIETTNNNKQSNQLGTGKLVLAGLTVTKGSGSNCTINNTSYDIIAGTANVVNGFTIPLAKTRITGTAEGLDRTTTYSLLTAPAFTDSDKLTIDESLKSAGWRKRVVVGESSSTIELYYHRGFVCIIR